MSFKTQLYINGKYVDAVRGGTFPTYNPATGEVITNVAAATAEDVDLAITAAVACFNSSNWGVNSTGAQRAEILRKIGASLEARKLEIAKLECLDQGKPLREALADLGDAITACSHFAQLAEERDAHQDEVIENGTNGDFTTKIRLEPIGVVAAITPWNYPLLMAIWKVIPAIAAGCTIVLKPSEFAPLSCLLFGEICTEAGLPDGALNVLTGYGADAGAPLSNDPRIDKISFTGSGPTGRRIMAAAAQGPRAVSMELGGKSPLIIFEDAELDGAVDWVLTGILWGSGQVCSATSRVLVHESLKESLVSKILARLPGVKIGNSLSSEFDDYSGPQMGPVISKQQYDKIWNFIDTAKANGYNVVYGGDRQHVSHCDANGYFIPPTIVVDPPTSAEVWKEEIFGPVLCIRSFVTEDEAVTEANDTVYGLAGAVFSRDEEVCARVAKNLRVGIVWKNCCQPAFVQAPWGGYKMSGFGRDIGRWGMEEFTGVKQITSCAPGFAWGLW
jgi:betaine-aldehyde dehydrogenase